MEVGHFPPGPTDALIGVLPNDAYLPTILCKVVLLWEAVAISVGKLRVAGSIPQMDQVQSVDLYF